MLSIYLLLKSFMFEVLLVPVALVVVDQSVFVSELEFHFAERASSVVEAVKS